MKNNKFEKAISLVLVIVMIISLCGLTAFAQGNDDAVNEQKTQQVVNPGGTSYYRANGDAGTASIYDVSLTKTLTATGTENLFNVDVNITYKNASTQVQSKDAAVNLVIDTSGSMKGTRIEAAKTAANNFLNSYAKDSTNKFYTSARWVSLVDYSEKRYSSTYDLSDSGGTQYWVNVNNEAALSYVQGVISSNLMTGGGTNTGYGMRLAADVLNTSTNTSIRNIANRFCILLTDGEPTLHDESYNDAGNFSSEDDVAYAQTGCNAVTATGAKLYAIAYGLSEATVPVSGHGNVAITTWLQSYCGATGVYSANNASDLTPAFNTILNQTTNTGTTSSAALDAMAATNATAYGIDFKEFTNENGGTYDTGTGKISWALATADTTPPAGYTSYSMSYKVQLDNTKSSFESGATYSLGKVSFTYKDASTNTEHTVESQAPSVKGYINSLSFTKKSTTGTEIGNAVFALSGSAPFNRSATSTSAGLVSFAGIPSGATYTLTESQAPAGYLVNNATTTVAIKYGVVALTGTLLGTNNTVTDQLDPNPQTFTINKTWLPSGTSGETVTANIYRLGSDSKKTGSPVATLSITGPSWSNSISLPTVDVTTGNAIRYTVEEAQTSSNYRFVGLAVTGNTFTLKNVSAATQNITLSKQWVAPDSVKTDVTIRLLQNGDKYRDYTLNSANSWSKTESVPNYDDSGAPYTYTVAEVINDKAYTTGTVKIKYTDFNVSVSGYTVTNTIAQSTISVSGAKTWNIAAYTEVKTATITLYADGTAVNTTTVTSPTTTYSFNNLPKYALSSITDTAYAGLVKNGHEIQYTVQETATGDSAIISTQSGKDFTNTLTGTREITVTKAWADEENANNTRPDAATLVISGDGQTYLWTCERVLVPVPAVAALEAVTGEEADADDKAVADDSTSEEDKTVASYTWTGATLSHTFSVPKYNASGAEIAYTVSEQGATDGQVPGKDNTYYSVETSGSMADGFIVTNTLNGGTTSVTVAKNWIYDKTDDTRTASATITVTGSNGTTRTFTTSKNESTTFSDLPLYANGTKVTYTAAESPVTGYNGGKAATPTRDGNTFTFTNKIDQAYVNVSVTKTWVGGSSDFRPTLTFTLKDGETTVATKHGADLTTGESVPLGLSFTSLPKYDFSDNSCRVISYNVVESMSGNMADRYTSSRSVDDDGVFNFTNTFYPGTTTFSGSKHWIAGSFSAEVKVGLFLGETMINSQTTQDLTYTFDELAAFNTDGRAINYYVRELGADNTPIAEGGTYTLSGVAYTVSYSGGEITNTLPQTKLSVSVTKVWNGPAAKSVTFDITRSSGGKVDEGYSKSIVLTSANVASDSSTWTDALPGQDKYDAKRNSYTYVVTEHGVNNGTVTLDGNQYTVSKADGNVFTNTIVDPENGTFTVNKVWAGTGAASEEITVQLYADGSLVEGKTLKLNAENLWRDDFSELQVYNANHQKIVYSVKEVGEANGFISLNNNSTKYAVSYTKGGDGRDGAVVTNNWLSTDSFSYKIYRYYTNTVDGVPTSYTANDSDWTSGTLNAVVPVDASKWLTYGGITYSFSKGVLGTTTYTNPSITFTLAKTVDGANTYELHLYYTRSYITPYIPGPIDPIPTPTPTNIPEETPPLAPVPSIEPTPSAPETIIPDDEAPLAAAPVVPGDPTSPQTGDNSNTVIFAILAALSALGLGAVAVIGKKKKHN